MSRNAKILIDLAVLAAAYGIWLLPKWRRLGKRPLLVYTLMYGCLAGIVRFTLMPVLTALPYCFDHPYIPMHMAPFEDVIHRHGDYVRQIVLNVVLFLPFGVLQPLCDRCRGRRPRFWLPAAGTGAQRRHRARAAAAARFPQSGYYGRHHEHDRRRARLCTLGAWKRLLQKTAGIGAELPVAFPVENRQKFLYTDVVTKTRITEKSNSEENYG